MSGINVLAAVLVAQAVFALAAGILVPVAPQVFASPGLRIAAGTTAVVLVVAAVAWAFRFIGNQQREGLHVRQAAGLMDTVLSTSREWLWAVDERGFFTFSSKASVTFLGYAPAELIGRPCGMVVDPNELVRARARLLAFKSGGDSAWIGSAVRCTHRDGSPVWMEIAGRFRPTADGRGGGGFEGVSQLVPPRTAQELADQDSRERIQGMIRRKLLLPAFQPIRDLSTGRVLGAEALCRFVSDDGVGPEYWFDKATAVGLGADLEFAALETALLAAAKLPPTVYVALNLAPDNCLDPRLSSVLKESAVPLNRIVLELTERLAVEAYDSLAAALAPLRAGGLRIAVDDAGSGFASMRHILRLHPDIIKLDRSLIAGIDHHAGQHALGAAMVGFAKQVGATLVAEGIATSAELAAVTRLGMAAGQGYHLGRPTVQPREWSKWCVHAHPGTPGESAVAI